MTDSRVERVIFDGNRKATGVQLHTGKIISASNEAIISAGAIATPHLLLHSGIGPADELSIHSIPIIHNLPGVGKNLIEHPAISTSLFLSPDTPDKSEVLSPLGRLQEPAAIAFVRLPELLASAEFSALPARTQQYLSKVPAAEVVPGADFSIFIPPADPPTPHRTIVDILMSPQSRGTIKLRSSSPADSPLIDLNFLSHPYDRRGIIECVRAGLSYQKSPSWQVGITGVAGGPKSESDEDILEFAKNHISATMHPVGTCKMGLDQDKYACVDRDFRVRGVTGLRVVDLSVAPLLGSTHTQSIAYLVGEVAAEKIIAEYGDILQ